MARPQADSTMNSLGSIIAAVVTVSKDPTLADGAFQLQISGLQPRHEITLHSSLRLPNSAVFECLAHYVADDQGRVSLDRHGSRGGFFTGITPMGPLSFMKPSPLNKRKYERFMVKDPTKPFKVDFRVFNGFVPSLEDPAFQNRFETAPNLTITRLYMSPGVKEIPVWDGNVRATLYIPPGNGPFPGVISMSGGYPGAMKHKAALLASHGFTALALKYFGEDDLSDDYSNLRLEYIEEAALFMKNHEMVNGRSGIGIVANCYGATIALYAASVLPKGLIRCVVAISGWSASLGSLNYKGENLQTGDYPILLCDDDSGDDDILSMKFEFCSPDGALDIIKNLGAPFHKRHEISYLFVNGEEDGYVPAGEYASATRTCLESVNHPDYRILFYKGAGHLIEHSFSPLANVAWTFKKPHLCGGEQPDHSIAQNDSWPKILEFVRKRLEVTDSKL